jgi:hypothetical protein
MDKRWTVEEPTIDHRKTHHGPWGMDDENPYAQSSREVIPLSRDDEYPALAPME